MNKHKKDPQIVNYNRARVASGYGPHNHLKRLIAKVRKKIAEEEEVEE